MRRRLILVFLAVSSLVTFAFVVPLAILVQRTVADRAVDAARSDAAAVVPALVSDGPQAEIEAVMALTGSGQADRMTILTSQGRQIGPDIGASQRVDRALTVGASEIGSTDNGVEVVVAVASGPDELSAIRIFVPRSLLWDGVARAWFVLAAVGVVLIAISVVVADLLARSVLRPTQSLVLAAKRLGDGDLDARVEPDPMPELADLAAAFNALGGRVATMLDRERELVADLSHRLRTPLTKLRMRIDHVSDRELAESLRADTADVTAAVNDLIREARGALSNDRQCDGVEVATDRIEFWRVLAEDQERTLTIAAGADTLPLAVDPVELAATIDVMIDNVFAHTTDGTDLEIGFDRNGGTARIWVGDGGPGFDDAAETGVHRGRSSAGSTGLGLDIVGQFSARSGGRSELGTSSLGGAQVTVFLPLAD